MPQLMANPGTLRRILVVDDEESLRHMLQVFLSREGFEVVSVPGAQAALAELGKAEEVQAPAAEPQSNATN